MSRFEILSFQFDEFVECVWTLNIKALNLRVDAYDNTYRSPECSYPAGASIDGELMVAFVFESSCLRVKEQSFKFFNLNPSGKLASGSGVTCIGKVLARRDDGDYEFDCGTNLRLAFEDKTELHPGDWVEVTGTLYFYPDFSTLVMPRKTP